MDDKRKPLFIAPVNIQAGDVITLLFSAPILIERDGVEIWRDETVPESVFEALIQEVKGDQTYENQNGKHDNDMPDL